MTIDQKLNKEVATLFARQKMPKAVGKTRRGITYNQFLSDRILMMDAIKRGIPYSLFDLIQSVSPFTEGDWSAILDLSPKSLQRYKQGAKTFKPIHSEKIVEMAEVSSFGKKVFGATERFRLWMESPSVALGSAKPIDLVKDSYGKEMVMRELNRIAHGILA